MTQQLTDEDPDLGAWETRQAIAEEQERVRGFLGGRVTAESILRDLSEGRIGSSLAYSRLLALPGMTGKRARQLLRTMSGQEDPTTADTTAADTTAADTDPGLPPGVPGWVDRSDFDISSLTNFNEVVAAIRNGDVGPLQGLNHLVSLGGDWTQSLLALRNLFPESAALAGRGVPEGQEADPDIWAQRQRGFDDPVTSLWEGQGIAPATAAQTRQDLSTTIGNRRDLFNRFLAASPQAQSITPAARNVLYNRFGPMSAQYSLGQLMNQPRTPFASPVARPTPQGAGANWWDQDPFYTTVSGDVGQGAVAPGDFQQFLGTNPTALTAQDYYSAFQKLAPMFAQGFAPNPQEEAIRESLLGAANEPTAENLITQAYASNLNPFFRDLAGGIANRRMDAWRAADPVTPIWQQYMTKGFGKDQW